MRIECVICKERIDEKGDYFKVDLFRMGKLVGTDYSHEVCWINREQFNSGIKQSLDDAIKLLKSKGLNEGTEQVVTI